MTRKTLQKYLFVALAAVTLVGGFAGVGGAQYYHSQAVVAAPGLTVVLNDNDFNDRWNHSNVNDRARFCHNVRRDCDNAGRDSRACHLKWKYCTPQHRDYGYYPNH